jgi:biopolymer transport protein TolQ
METAWAQTKVNVAINNNLWDSLLGASPIVKLTLLALVGMSVVCWAIFFSKRKQLKLMRDANGPFEDRFWKAKSLDALYEDVTDFQYSSLARVFRAGYLELQKIAESGLVDKVEGSATPRLFGMDNLERALRKAVDSEVQLLEQRLVILATTGSTGPFIGLFGTVWGIMGAFHQIGLTGAASLAVVAPGISEALVATAIGLAAAIPAVICYNYFVGQIRREEINLTNFSSDFLNIAKRNFFRDN